MFCSCMGYINHLYSTLYPYEFSFHSLTMKASVKKTTKSAKRSSRSSTMRFQPLFMPSNAIDGIFETEESDEDPVFQAALDEYIFCLERADQSHVDELNLTNSVTSEINNQQMIAVSNKQHKLQKISTLHRFHHYAFQMLKRHQKLRIGQRFNNLCKAEASKMKYKSDCTISEDNSNYHQDIIESTYSQELYRFAKCYFKTQGCNIVEDKTLLTDSLKLIIPNDINIWHFDIIGKASEWLYFENPDQWSNVLPVRWTGQIANFYQPFVIRYKKCDSGRDITFMGLCPYCLVTSQDFTENFNRLFVPLRGRRYEAHLGTVHGVYSSGHEMPPPNLAEKKGELYASCMDCHQAKKLVQVSVHSPESLLLSYFKHGMRLHCKDRTPPQNPKTTGSQTSYFSPPTSYKFNRC